MDLSIQIEEVNESNRLLNLLIIKVDKLQDELDKLRLEKTLQEEITIFEAVKLMDVAVSSMKNFNRDYKCILQPIKGRPTRYLRDNVLKFIELRRKGELKQYKGKNISFTISSAS